ncbi:DUF2951 domain-containing protein [Staphylococcus chromogenes]|uniref:DUF2951 domain-containing protein n=4 Tax=Staphylococcus chromogenes TaxID=46126 RepID=A0AAE5T1J4_STACR|nr:MULTISPECIES: DUF2951 family protein [Staphylococcus]KDP13623.1 putative phage membrane protein [Staphylococcus chromogenes MU 970]MBV5138921.1 DUF2951 domain-containing protein [Staphylococcus chromogenes]MBW6090147.1 DUF2951 domain-containing protein [Staphylococcus chromogenes]MCD9060723.1 DUF2951 domain-containing protein [Staphylococcus chromogenes]MCD9062968.1 DUF2951 domain-containing protein [Staphylococcus chromogenes]
MESYQRETERRLSRLEENDDKIFDSLDEIKNTQHSQNLINQKMDFTLDSINREREIDKENKETNKKNIREMKMYVIGLVGTIVGSLIIAILRTFFGI